MTAAVHGLGKYSGEKGKKRVRENNLSIGARWVAEEKRKVSVLHDGIFNKRGGKKKRWEVCLLRGRKKGRRVCLEVLFLGEYSCQG